jgi:hypothetical protein
VTYIQELSQVEGFPTANLAEHDAVGAVTQSRLQQIADFNSRRGILAATDLEANQVWLCEPNFGGILNKKEGNQVLLIRFYLLNSFFTRSRSLQAQLIVRRASCALPLR